MSNLRDLRKAIDAKSAEAAAAHRAYVEARDSAVKEHGDAILSDPDVFQKLDDLGKVADAARVEVDGMKDRYASLLERDAGGAPIELATGDRETDRRSLGEAFVKSDAYAALKASGALDNREMPLGSTAGIKVASRAELKTLITGASDTSGGAFVVADRQPGLVELLRRPLVVADLVTVGETDSDLVEFVEQTSRTNAAAETAEAGATGDGSGAAPESAVAYAVKNTSVRDIVHFIPATKRALADASILSGLINSELVDGVRERLDDQMVTGDGAGENLTGIENASGLPTQALGTDSRSDAVHKAITKIRNEFIEPSVILIHPNDFEELVLEKDANGNYIYGPPSAPQRGSVWGLRPVVSKAVTEGSPLVGNFGRGATLWLRQGVVVSASDSHDDFFTRRMVAVMASLRAAFAVIRPKAFCQVTGF